MCHFRLDREHCLAVASLQGKSTAQRRDAETKSQQSLIASRAIRCEYYGQLLYILTGNVLPRNERAPDHDA